MFEYRGSFNKDLMRPLDRKLADKDSCDRKGVNVWADVNFSKMLLAWFVAFYDLTAPPKQMMNFDGFAKGRNQWSTKTENTVLSFHPENLRLML